MNPDLVHFKLCHLNNNNDDDDHESSSTTVLHTTIS